MPSIISAGTTSGTSLNFSGDTSGNLEFKTQGGANTITIANQTGTLNAAGPAFSVYAANNQTLTSGVATKLQLNTKNFDTNSNYSTANYRFTPTVAGYYQFSATSSISFSANTGYLYLVFIYKNGSEYSRGSGYYAGGGTNILTGGISSVSSIIYCNGSTDYIEFYARGDASSGTISTDTGGNSWNFGCGSLIRGA
jgi:hypothetical protein